MNAGYTWREVIAAAAPGERVVDRLAHRWRHGSPAEWSDRIRRGEVTLDGAAAVGSAPLRAGQTLAWARPPWEEPAVPLSFGAAPSRRRPARGRQAGGAADVPGGRLLEHRCPSRGAGRRRRRPPARPRDERAAVCAQRAGATRRRRRGARGVRRRYLGLVEGHPRDDSFSIDVPIGERPHPEIGRVFAAAADGKSSRTQVVTRARRADGRALVEIEIASGRPHQIRIHLAYAGHPLAGEPFYGAGGAPRERDGAAESGARPGDVGYALHAWRLDLAHPVTGAPLALECPPPPELRA
jgi:23S rRNA pseudouridine1911/1915/1917 synthase